MVLWKSTPRRGKDFEVEKISLVDFLPSNWVILRGLYLVDGNIISTLSSWSSKIWADWVSIN